MIAKLPLVPFVIINLTRLHESEIQVKGNQLLISLKETLNG